MNSSNIRATYKKDKDVKSVTVVLTVVSDHHRHLFVTVLLTIKLSRGARLMQMAGGHALSRRLSEAAASDEAKAARLQAQYEAQQAAALHKKRKDAQEQQQLIMRTRQQQVRPSQHDHYYTS